MTYVRAEQLLIQRGDDWYWVGPIEPALRLMAGSYDHVSAIWNGQMWATTTVDVGVNGPTEHEWGNARTLDEALRFLIGAAFGPVDAEYDEARLRADLDRVGGV